MVSAESERLAQIGHCSRRYHNKISELYDRRLFLKLTSLRCTKSSFISHGQVHKEIVRLGMTDCPYFLPGGGWGIPWYCPPAPLVWNCWFCTARHENWYICKHVCAHKAKQTMQATLAGVMGMAKLLRNWNFYLYLKEAL